jgi:LysM repeat protein
MAFNDSYKYQMYLSYNYNKEITKFPLLPETVRVDYGSSVDSVDIVGLGEVVRKKDRPAVAVSFGVALPARWFVGSKVKDMQAPEMLKNRFVRWKDGNPPCRLLITETGINMVCRISELSYEERGVEKGALYVEMTLKEYRPVSARKADLDANGKIIDLTERVAVPADKRDIPGTYTTVSGDTFSRVSKRFYGTADRWQDIYAANQSKVMHPALLRPGTVLKLPK